jgi:hypothetical protein
MTSVNNSIYLGFQTRGLNATGSTNEIVIGYDVVGLGSNTTVLGNASTTFGRWFGNLLVGTSTNAGFALDVNGTARVSGSLTVSNGGFIFNINNAAASLVLRSGDANSAGANIGLDSGNLTFITRVLTNVERMRINSTSGNILINTTTDVASSKLTIESTTQGVLFPRMTTTQKNAIASPATGLVVYDNTLNKLSVFTGLVWETVTSL